MGIFDWVLVIFIVIVVVISAVGVYKALKD
jgi:hypothetical protein